MFVSLEVNPVKWVDLCFIYLTRKVDFTLTSHLEYLVLSDCQLSGIVATNICDMFNTVLNGGLWLDGL